MDLREARFFKRLNQWDLAIKTGIPQSRISLLERGYIRPREDEKNRLSQVLEVKPEDLFPVEVCL